MSLKVGIPFRSFSAAGWVALGGIASHAIATVNISFLFALGSKLVAGTAKTAPT
ncbi:hypothetical protein H6F96_23215 [Microcoleus sp. FACHB-53]|nr:hypothetical protein [Microcoleus sp. FACHB-53]